MDARIICKVTRRDVHSFYLMSNGKSYFLLNQKFKGAVHEYYKKGVSLADATDFTKAHRNRAILRIMNKLPMYIKYLEKEYDITVLKQTRKKKERAQKRKAA